MAINCITSSAVKERDTRDLTLLVLTPDYPDEKHRYIGSIYVKSQLEPLKPFFKKIIVICPVPFSFGMKPSDRYCSDYQYDNVNVYFPRCFFLPRSWPIPFLTNRHKMIFDFRFRAVLQLIRKRGIGFDLIHAHFTWPSAYIAIQLKKKFHVPVVATIHEDSSWLEEEIRMDQPRLGRTWRECDVLIRVNKKEVPVLSLYNNHTIYIPNGFGPAFHPMDKQECRTFLNLSAHSKIVLGLAQLIERKGFSYLIDAMEQVIKKDPSVICYIGGSGPEKQNLKDRIQVKGLQKNVFLLGFLPESQIVRWINSADVFVLPSLHEGNPTVMFECLGCGVPFIGTAVGGIPEIITSDTYGYICKSADADDLARAIIRALDKAWDVKAITGYAKKFSWESVGCEIMGVYKQLIRLSVPHR